MPINYRIAIGLLQTLVIVVYPGLISAQVYPDLGLHGTVTWLDQTHIRVEYDWSDDNQLLDWSLTNGATLVRGNGTVTIAGGNSSVRAMILRHEIKCGRIIAKNAVALTSAGHLNFYSNVATFGGSFAPNPGLGAILVTTHNFWTHDGSDVGNFGSSMLEVGIERDYEYTASETGMTFKSSANNITYAYIAPCSLEIDRKVALGGWGGDTRWGKLTIEGEITLPWEHDPVPPDVINIQSSGSTFAPVIEITGNPVIEWIFSDSTISSSSTPFKDYGTSGSRHNYLRVTPWNALIGINVGYDASDGGYPGPAIIPNQHVIGIQNLHLVKASLQYLCANYNPLDELDLSELTTLRFIELFNCHNLASLKLGSHPYLERICVEDCNLEYLDLSGCQALEDIRCALNNNPEIIWGSVGQAIWHICNRDNPQYTSNLPSLSQFPVLIELLNWNTNQTGPFVCHNKIIQRIESYNNYYTSLDIGGCTNLRILNMIGNNLGEINLGDANRLDSLLLNDCDLTVSRVDYVLSTLDEAGNYSGYLDLTGNSAPSETGLSYVKNLRDKAWTVLINEIRENDPIKLTLNQGILKITMYDNLISKRANLYSLNGTMLFNRIIESDILEINVKDFPSGLYIITISDDEIIQTRKIFL